MTNSIPQTPKPVNEPIRSYAPGSSERRSLQRRLAEMKSDHIEIPAIIGGNEVRTGNTMEVTTPHDHSQSLATVHQCGGEEVSQAIEAALEARHDWARMAWEERASIFLKAAELLAGSWRDTLNAATMLGQSKNAYQAEIDAACEMIDFWRFNVHYMQRIYEEQPESSRGVWNRLQYRPLEGFVFAVTPFNFTSIQGNLPTAPALMGNTVIWKPSSTSLYSAYFTQRLLEEAGLPPGVINLVPGHGPDIGDPVFASKDFAGLHFTGSTKTFRSMWKTIGNNIANYTSYPRIVGETGGKDFVIAHSSADPVAVATAILRGGFEYQGQKCSAASRIYAPRSLWGEIRNELLEQLDSVTMGPVEDFTNFMNAVIDRPSYDKITGYIRDAFSDDNTKILHGGKYSDEDGFFIEPTVLLVDDPGHRTMCEEIFGPVVSIYVYEDAQYDLALDKLDETSPYALTGAVFARDRQIISKSTDRLMDNAGNFYINDKPTGAVVGQQPFGGARGSGTNDKAGSYLNLVRWISARSIKENMDPARHFAYPFLQPDVEDVTQAEEAY